MRTISSFLLAATWALYTPMLSAQPVLIEDFAYPAGDSLKNCGWESTSGSLTNSILVTEPGLTLEGHPGSGVGNAATLQSSGQDVARTFPPDSSGVFFVSFLLRVLSARGGDYVLYLSPSPVSTAGVARFYVRNAANGNLAFGIAKKGSNTVPTYQFSDSIFAPNTTYMVVVKYTFRPDSSSDDEARLYVFGSGHLPAAEPGEPAAGPATDATSDAAVIAALVLRQGDASKAPVAVIDAIRITRTWEPPLPVVLSSFTAEVEQPGASVRLRWTTLSESHNYGFEVQRSRAADGPFATLDGAFVPGQGTTVLPHSYSYLDRPPAGGVWFYRLRQIDLDGGERFSETVYADLLTAVSVREEEFPSLLQNYPNPFNPSTTVLFVPHRGGSARLEVFGADGALVSVPFAGPAQAGQTYRADIDGGAWAAGVYFYRLSVGGVTQVKRMLLVR